MKDAVGGDVTVAGHMFDDPGAGGGGGGAASNMSRWSAS